MSYNALNGVRDLQVTLKEINLYPGNIDGVWGTGCATAAGTLFQHYASTHNTPVPAVAPATPNQVDVIKCTQSALEAIGLYHAGVDGVWGNGTRQAFDLVKESYRVSNNLPKYAPAWSKRVGPEFIQDCSTWVNERGLVSYCLDYLMTIMCFESAGTFDPAKQNAAGAEAFGLIQFMKGAATDLGTTVDALRQMTQLQQLQYVFKYFDKRMSAYKLRDLEDFYLSVFYPAAIGRSADTVVFATGTKGYDQNRGLDLDKNGNITVGEISSRIYQNYYQGMLPQNRSVYGK